MSSLYLLLPFGFPLSLTLYVCPSLSLSLSLRFHPRARKSLSLPWASSSPRRSLLMAFDCSLDMQDNGSAERNLLVPPSLILERALRESALETLFSRAREGVLYLAFSFSLSLFHSLLSFVSTDGREKVHAYVCVLTPGSRRMAISIFEKFQIREFARI